MQPLLPLAALALLSAVSAASGGLGSGCNGPNRCIRASDCRRSIMQHPKSRERENVLFNCGFEGLNLLVCCPPAAYGEEEEETLGHVSAGPAAAAGHGTTQYPTQRTTTYVPTRPTQAPFRATQKTTQSSYEIKTTQKTTTQPSYIDIRHQLQNFTNSPYVESKPITEATFVSNNKQTQRTNQGDKNKQSQTQAPYIENKTTQKTTQTPYIENRPPQRHTQGPYTNQDRTTQSPYIEKRPNTPVSTVDARPTHTTPKFTRPQETRATRPSTLRPTETSHYITHSSPDRSTRDPYDPRPEVFEEVVRPVQQSGVSNSRPLQHSANQNTQNTHQGTHQGNYQGTNQETLHSNNQPLQGSRPNSYGQEAVQTTDYIPTDQQNARPKRPAAPDIVFEEHGTIYPQRPNPRPIQSQKPSYEVDQSMKQTQLPPNRIQTTTQAYYTPPRRPFEPPYIIDGPEGPPVQKPTSQPYEETDLQRPQSSRPTSRPPNSSSTYPGANNVGSGESGHIWPSSQHVRPQVQTRPSTSAPVKNEDDLTRHRNFRLLPPDICGTNAVGEDRIVNGQNATLGQFPWMALLGNKASEAAEDFVSVCGGTLISWKYVLTAAHCLKKSVRLVRLGEHVVSTQPDCDQDGLCADPVVDIEIEEKIPHPSYGKPYLKNDIGLIRLRQAQPRLFSSYVRPICLPLVQEKQKPGRRLIVAGWGTTRRGSKISSDVLQMAALPEVGLVECNDAQEDDILKPVIASQMCAAVTDHSASSCYGDSGGPLMDIQQGRGRQQDEPAYVQLGIVSVGSDDCGLHGAPSIYTRVSSFTPWILDTLRD